jgi:tetratricopeptide (TPR) repeat protein
LATADVAAAQMGTIVRGEVVDEKGNIVVGATATFQDLDSDRTYTSESESGGIFVVLIPPSRYQITVEKEGFRGARFEYQIRRSDGFEIPRIEIVSAQSIRDAALADVNRQFKEAGELAQAGKLDEAQAIFEDILEERPEVAEAHYNVGLLLARKDELDPAAAALEKALELQPNHGPAALALAGIYAESGRTEEAAATIEKAVGGHPDEPEVQIAAAYFYLNAGRDEEARPFLERLRVLEPENAEAHYLLASVAIRQGELAAAVEFLERFLELADADDKYRAPAEEMLPDLKQHVAREDAAEPAPQAPE